MGQLDGKVAAVIGASSGIGLATAQLLGAEGAHVFITGRRAMELEAARDLIGGAVTAVQGDASDLADIDRLRAAIDDAEGALDVLVLNAGHLDMVATAEATPAHFDATFGVNTRGPFFAVQKLEGLMRDGGSIVLISSSGHVKGIAQFATYSASKAALRSLARSWADDYKGRGIRVNAISPGPIDTPMIDLQLPPEEAAATRAAMAATIPLGRMGRPEEIASAVLFLASDASTYITGIDLPVDGGQASL